jgi:hypothetical protein
MTEATLLPDAENILSDVDFVSPGIDDSIYLSTVLKLS